MRDEQLYRLLAENFPSGIVLVFDADLRYTLVAGKGLEDVGITKDRLEGQRVGALVSPETAARLEQDYRRVFDGEEADYELEFADRTLLGRLIPVTNDAGAVEYGMGILQDVTERRRHEGRLERTNRQLEQFAHVLSHDLRNPLNIALGHVELAREEAASEHLDRAASALERIQELVADVLTLARDGNVIDERTPVLLADVAEAAWRSVDSHGAELTVVSSFALWADASRLQQTFENLFRNAVQHGGADVTVRVGTLDDGFYVEDDGPGIPPAHRETAFERGYSSDDDGTGLGLSIVSDIVEAHGWSIRSIEGENSGARFEVTGVTLVSPGADAN